MKHIHLPSLTELAANCDEPRVHPNGFIQLDLDAVHRLHVWHPRLPYRQKTYHTVHDHVFGFTSQVFSGRLVNVQYGILPNDLHGRHYLAQAECSTAEETLLVGAPQPQFYQLMQLEAFVVQPGEQYELEAFQFHESLANEPTLTIIRKDGLTAAQGNSQKPTVIIGRGVKPDNDFRRDAVDTDVLWELIAEAYPS